MDTPTRATRQAAEAATRAEREPAEPGGQAGGQGGGRALATELKVYTWKVLIAVGVFGLVFLVWRVADALLLVFAGVLFAILLQRVAGLVRHYTGLSQGWSLAVVLLLLTALVVGGGFLLGQSVVSQFDQLTQQISRGVDQLPPAIRDQIAEQGRDATSWINRLRSVASSVVFFLGDAVVVIFTAIYLAASPKVYRRGIVLLVPPRGHERAHEVLDVTGDSLWKWLIGQIAAMAIVGALTTAGLLLLGIPSAAALGFLAGLLEFVPLLGPVLAAVPGILIAFSQSPQDAIWVALLYLAIQQIEGNLITPLMQKRVVDLPPVITIGAIAAGGLVFGILGMFLATPLAIVALVLVNMLYIEDKLGEGRHFPSEDTGKSG
ncbi:AI-2E family transporter [Azospirillum rugosum]|uniref:PurR-regulated permease PerM n=1 Tax=Azospirillum rugosum TaxID=416170 RepID=A0ABS4SHM8_9PROT|nr:AI-2E family transporter [Azospirillum rugosum]MBP2292002.1 putative PurR-regulated permease PerM [Azospirillum rugosum]MDQ0525862.1 putative PurR-regulated permease PerM [Azospirillum rugosum]